MDAVATAKLALDSSGLDRGLMSAQKSVAQFAKTAGALVAGAFAFDKIISGFSSAIEKGDQLQDIAEKFGVSASKLQLLGNAASVFGSGLDQVSAGLNKLSLAQQKALAGDNGLQNTFQEVGIGIEELKSMKPEDILLRISDSFASGANEGRQFIIVNELLGKAQTDLIKVLNQGSAAIIAQGEAIGVWSDDTISQLSEASDALKKFQNIITIGFGAIVGFGLKVANELQPIIDIFTQFMAAGQQFGKFNFSAGSAILKAMNYQEARSRYAQQKQESQKTATPVELPGDLAAMAEEKKRLDKSLYDEEIYSLQEEAKLKENREKTLFDRMMRDAEFARDEKKRILELEKETALRNKEAIMRGMEVSGTILDKVRASAERLGMGGIVRQIDLQRRQQERQTDVSLLSSIGAGPRDSRFRNNETIQALTQTEGDLQRKQNADLLQSFSTMQSLVSEISRKIDDKLGVPILKAAY